MCEPWVSKDVLKGLYNGIHSLRKTYEYSFSNLRAFLTKVIVFDRANIVDEEELLWWKVMGISDAWIKGYVRVAFVWDGTHLHARADFEGAAEGGDDAWDVICSV